jgi:hypothetical protein
VGARGFHLYDRTTRRARFSSITTFGDGAAGIQVSKGVPGTHLVRPARSRRAAGLSGLITDEERNGAT